MTFLKGHKSDPFVFDYDETKDLGADLNAGYAKIEEYIHVYGFGPLIDKSAIAEQIIEGIKSIFPIFEMQIHANRYIEIIDAAKTQLNDLSSELLNQAHSQVHCLDNVTGQDR